MQKASPRSLDWQVYLQEFCFPCHASPRTRRQRSEMRKVLKSVYCYSLYETYFVWFYWLISCFLLKLEGRRENQSSVRRCPPAIPISGSSSGHSYPWYSLNRSSWILRNRPIHLPRRRAANKTCQKAKPKGVNSVRMNRILLLGRAA